MSNAINEIDNTDLVFVFGYNPADSHPIVANHVINAKRNGAKIIVCDPRKIETARIADMHIALKNGSNIALLNAMGHVIIEENLYDKAFVASRTEGFEEYRKIVEGYTPESVEDITGVSASEIRQAARMYAQAKSAAILWGMGVTQFYQGVETVRSLTSLAMLTGNLGKPHAGVNPVRGQNNVQGACDMGALPDTYPGYQYVKDPANREKFAKAWGVESLPAHTGYRISELPHHVHVRLVRHERGGRPRKQFRRLHEGRKELPDGTRNKTEHSESVHADGNPAPERVRAGAVGVESEIPLPVSGSEQRRGRTVPHHGKRIRIGTVRPCALHVAICKQNFLPGSLHELRSGEKSVDPSTAGHRHVVCDDIGGKTERVMETRRHRGKTVAPRKAYGDDAADLGRVCPLKRTLSRRKSEIENIGAFRRDAAGLEARSLHYRLRLLRADEFRQACEVVHGVRGNAAEHGLDIDTFNSHGAPSLP